MSGFSPLSQDQFDKLVAQDPQFGLTTALETGVIEDYQVRELNRDQIDLFNNWGLLTLLGAQAGYPFVGPNGLHIYKDNGLTYKRQSKSTLSADDIDKILAHSAEQLNVLNDANVYHLIVHSRLSFERAMELTPEEYIRISKKSDAAPSSEAEKNKPAKHNYNLVFRDNLTGADAVLKFIAALPDEYWPDALFLVKLFELSRQLPENERAGISELPNLPIEHLRVLERHQKNREYPVLAGILSLASPLVNSSQEILRPRQLPFDRIGTYSADQIETIGLASDGIRSELFSIDEILSLNDLERSKVAHHLGKIILRKPDATLEKETQGHLTRNDVYSLTAQEAELLEYLSDYMNNGLATKDDILELTDRPGITHLLGSKKPLLDYFIANTDISILSLLELDHEGEQSLANACSDANAWSNKDLSDEEKIAMISRALTSNTSESNALPTANQDELRRFEIC